MRKLNSKIIIFFMAMVFTLAVSPSIFAKDKLNSAQFSIYSGPVVHESVSNVHGIHKNYAISLMTGGTMTPDQTTMDANVHGLDIKQDIILGFDWRYYFGSHFFDIGMNMDISFSAIDIPAQTITIEGIPLNAISQPKADGDIVSFSIGPIFRYEGYGIFENLNPYISPSIAFHYGTVNNSNLYPNNYEVDGTNGEFYGTFGTSSLNGLGYGLKIGAEYFMTDNLGLLMEYRYTKNDLIVDSFRSYQSGLEMTMQTQSLLIGTMWSF